MTPKVDIFLGFWSVDDEHEGAEEEGGHHRDHSPPELEIGTQLGHHVHTVITTKLLKISVLFNPHWSSNINQLVLE